eukprot:Pompholyxophrys_punicea_v1_NODE_963_length_1093_cov_13.210983.p1 type:complete len:109 gc:universal NODE_963_length_1093_cov_13.210983:212-538(+)
MLIFHISADPRKPFREFLSCPFKPSWKMATSIRFSQSIIGKTSGFCKCVYRKRLSNCLFNGNPSSTNLPTKIPPTTMLKWPQENPWVKVSVITHTRWHALQSLWTCCW